MLSSFRLATRDARIFPRYARPITTRKEVPDQRKQALDIFKTHEDPFKIAPKEAAPATPKVIQPKLDLETMHHHIPPAESPILQFLTTMIMKHGEYAKAQRTVSNMLLHIYAMTRSPPMPIVEQAVLTASPAVRCKNQKQRGGKSLKKPVALSERQRTSLALKWIREEVTKKGAPGKKYEERLAREMIAIVKGSSAVLGLKKKMHEEAMANRGSLSRR